MSQEECTKYCEFCNVCRGFRWTNDGMPIPPPKERCASDGSELCGFNVFGRGSGFRMTFTNGYCLGVQWEDNRRNRLEMDCAHQGKASVFLHPDTDSYGWKDRLVKIVGMQFANPRLNISVDEIAGIIGKMATVKKGDHLSALQALQTGE